MTATSLPLLTFGHGTADQAHIVELLHGAGVGGVVDIRRFPGSRRYPHVARDAMAQWLPAAGIDYRWEPRLGGRRRPAAPGPPGPDAWWRVEAFRAYAAHTRTQDFRDGITSLLADVAATDRGATVVMCSETLWWRCHRRLVSDVVVLLHGTPVEHLGHDGRRTAHASSPGARVTPAGLVYDLSR